MTVGTTVTYDTVVYTGPGTDVIADSGSGNDLLLGLGSYNDIVAGSWNDIVYGGYGTNYLTAGTGNDVLVGRGALNLLYGGLGRDVLIGGPGQSFLYGGVGDDILIGGTVSFDLNTAALAAVLEEWTSANSFATRVGHLDGTIPGGANGAFLLTPATVETNGFMNELIAGAGQDWFFAHLTGAFPHDLVVNTFLDLVTDI